MCCLYKLPDFTNKATSTGFTLQMRLRVDAVMMREKWLPEIGGNLLATRGGERKKEEIMREEGIIRHSGPGSGSQQ
jgi:hypothetical protein